MFLQYTGSLGTRRSLEPSVSQKQQNEVPKFLGESLITGKVRIHVVLLENVNFNRKYKGNLTFIVW